MQDQARTQIIAITAEGVLAFLGNHATSPDMKSFKGSIHWIAILAVSFIICACASVQRQAAPSSPDRPKPGKGLVHFYREKKLEGWGVGYNIRDGEKKIGGLPNGSYFVYDATPGPHRFSASTESTAERTIEVQPGKTYYVRGEVEMGLFVGRPHLTIVDPAEGASAINGLKRVVLSAD
jgi:Protein of unknown function (DUF2846)